MAVENLKSGPITNRDATPRVLNGAHLEGGLTREAVATLEMTSAGDAGSTYRMVSIPSNARVSRVLLYSDDSGTTGLLDIGIYRTTADGGAVVDADFFASAVDVKTAALNGTDVTHESGVFNIDDVEKPLWSALGLTADPNLFYDVVLTSTEAPSAATTTVSIKVMYTF